MRTWVKALADHRCAYCGTHIVSGELIEVAELEKVSAKFYYCREHAQTAMPLDIPNLPTEMEHYTIGEMEQIKQSRERMRHISELGMPSDWARRASGEHSE